MFTALKALLSSEDSKIDVTTFNAQDVRLAEAALLFHVIQSDGKILDVEREKMKEVLSEDFDLSDAEIEELINAAQFADGEAIDLFRFTSLLKANLELDRRIQIVENLWEMVYADGVVHELEDNVVWRIAELLNIQTPERMEMKRRVKARVEQS
ncbi:MAG: TerB family tellurite resistance protein [Nitratireductor sp.]